MDFSPAMKSCVKRLKEAKVKMVLVTGRMHCAALPVAKELGLETPIISYQGGLIKTYDGETLFQENLNSDYAKKLLNGQEKITFTLICI